MPNKEEILQKQTFKGDVTELEKRVYYTLTQDKGLPQHRTAKLASLMVKHLHERGLVSEEEIDEWLLECLD